MWVRLHAWAGAHAHTHTFPLKFLLMKYIYWAKLIFSFHVCMPYVLQSILLSCFSMTSLLESTIIRDSFILYIDNEKVTNYVQKTECFSNTYLPLYYFENRVNPLSHGLAVDCVKEGMKVFKQWRVSLKIIKMMIHPMPQHIQHSELHRLTIFFPIPLPVFPLGVLDCLFWLQRVLVVIIDQWWIRNVESLHQEVQEFLYSQLQVHLNSNILNNLSYIL